MEALTKFRESLYNQFPVRADALMNLLDALSSDGHIARSVVQLSESHQFKRKYSSITDAISNGLSVVDWEGVERLVYHSCFDETARTPPCFLIDTTPCPRPFAKTLEDRNIVHAPNPAPGNKPICVGQAYSCIALLPSEHDAQGKKWLIPLSAKRVRSDEKGNEVGMLQVKDIISQLQLKHDLSASVGDSLYGSEKCREIAGSCEGLVHIFRINRKRNLYSTPKRSSHKTGRGRRKEYGDKMSLANTDTHLKPTATSKTGFLSRSGNVYSVTIDAWDDMLIRGSKRYRGSKHPITLCRVEVKNSEGNLIFKNPLWLGVLGKLRSQLSLVSVYQYYRSRYDIEHFFRFGKSKLLLDAFQTPEVTHEENWWRLCLLAYTQLYLSKSAVSQRPKEWEKYLPEYRRNYQVRELCSPAQVQRGFGSLVDEIGTPAKPSKTRGTASGRKDGYKPQKRAELAIVFKTKAAIKKFNKLISPELDINGEMPNPKEIDRLLKTVITILHKHQIDTQQFTNMLCDTG